MGSVARAWHGDSTFWQPQDSAGVPDTPPTAPGSLTAFAIDASTVDLDWTAASSPGDMNTWEIRYLSGSTPPANETEGTLATRVSVGTLNATITGLTESDYAFTVFGRTPEGLYGPGAMDTVSLYVVTSISISGGKTVNAGSSATLTATVTGASTGTVYFRSGSATGTIVHTDTSSPWTYAAAPSSTTTYYAEYVANGNYLGSKSSSGTTVTVNQKKYASVTRTSRCGGCYKFAQSSSPYTISTSFSMPRQGYAYQFRIQAQGYYGYNQGTSPYYNPFVDGTYKGNQNVAEASGSDSGWSQWFSLSDLNLGSGTHTVGFARNTSYGTQWDYSSSGDDQSILYEVAYWYW